MTQPLSTPSLADQALLSPDPRLTTLQPGTVPLRLGVLASGNGSNFEAVIQAIAQQQLQASIQVLIYNNPTAKAAERAERHHIPKVLLNHRDYPNREALDRAIAHTLRTHNVDWVVMAGWMRIVTAELIQAYPDRMINIHPSLLPAFKGIHAIEQALAAGVRLTGCTAHLVTVDMDSGPILAQAAVPILPEDTAESLHARVQVQEHRILPLAIAIAAQQR